MSEQGDSKETDKAEDTENDEEGGFDSECSCTETQESNNRDSRRDSDCHCNHTSDDHDEEPCERLAGGQSCGRIQVYCNSCLEACVPCTAKHDKDGE